MTEAKQSPDLSSLAADYDIVGEVGGARDARVYMANRKDPAGKRRDDKTAVLISVVASQPKRGVEVLLGFPWKANDDVGRQGEARYRVPECRHAADVLVLRVAPNHALQQAITPRLHRQMHVLR